MPANFTGLIANRKSFSTLWFVFFFTINGFFVSTCNRCAYLFCFFKIISMFLIFNFDQKLTCNLHFKIMGKTNKWKKNDYNKKNN